MKNIPQKYTSAAKAPGKVILLQNRTPLDYEIIIAQRLAQTGLDVTFIQEGILHTPDILFDQKYWEIKRPLGNGKRTLRHQLQRAILQSENIIIDISITKIPLSNIISHLTKLAEENHMIKRLLVVTRDKNILTIKWS